MGKIKKPSKKISVVLVLLLLTVLVGGYFYRQANQDTPASSSNNPPKHKQIVNLNPPTEEDKASGDAAKQNLLDRENAQNTTPTKTSSGKISVTPIITYAGQYGQQVEVGSGVNGVFEDGGTCVLTLESNGKQLNKSVTGVKDASSVNCPTMIIPRSSLSAGQWQATISYSSPTSEGKSESKTVEVK